MSDPSVIQGLQRPPNQNGGEPVAPAGQINVQHLEGVDQTDCVESETDKSGTWSDKLNQRRRLVQASLQLLTSQQVSRLGALKKVATQAVAKKALDAKPVVPGYDKKAKVAAKPDEPIASAAMFLENLARSDKVASAAVESNPSKRHTTSPSR